MVTLPLSYWTFSKSLVDWLAEVGVIVGLEARGVLATLGEKLTIEALEQPNLLPMAVLDVQLIDLLTAHSSSWKIDSVRITSADAEPLRRSSPRNTNVPKVLAAPVQGERRRPRSMRLRRCHNGLRHHLRFPPWLHG